MTQAVRRGRGPDRLLALLLPLFALLLLGGCRAAPTPTVGAAASLRRVMPELVQAHGSPIAVTYGGSGTLRQQVVGGAPIDAVVLAAAQPVDELIGAGLGDPSTRARIATNQLVLVSPRGAPPRRFKDLAALPAGERIAMGDPSFVPAGDYGRQVLTTLGSWDGLADRVVFVSDVGMALAHARRGEVAAALVYATDAQGIDDVVVTDTWPGEPRPEVVAVATSEDEGARAFLRFLATAPAQALLARHGFGPAAEVRR